MHIILLLAAIVLVVWLYYKWMKLPEEERAKRGKKYFLWILIVILLLMVLTGRTHWIFAVFAGLLAIFQRLMQLLPYWPIFKKFFGSADGASKKAAANNKTMSREEAADILGIKTTANKKEVIAAHRRLMQKVHPDRGGSDALAAQINQAKKVLLG